MLDLLKSRAEVKAVARLVEVLSTAFGAVAQLVEALSKALVIVIVAVLLQLAIVHTGVGVVNR